MTTSTKRTYLEIALLIVFIAIIVGIVKIPLITSLSSKFYHLITIALTVILPLFYGLLILPTKKSKVTVIPVFILGLIVSGAIIPENEQYLFTIMKNGVLPFIELFVVGYILFKIRQTVKSYKKQQGFKLDFYTALKYATQKAFPGGAGYALAGEIAMFYYGLLLWKERTSETNDLTYHKNNSGVSVWGMIIFLIIIETLVAHFFLQRWNEIIAWIFSGISIYTVFQMLGIMRSMSKRPFILKDDSIEIRYAIYAESEINFEEIENIELTSKSFEKDSGIRCLSPLKEMEGHNVILHLKSEQTLYLLYGIKRKYKTIAFYIDEPYKLKVAIDKFLTTKNS